MPRFLPQDLPPRVWTKEKGLPDNSVTAILQTSDGYLWVGTAGGLARFDGVRFVTIAPPSAKSNVVVRVTALCEDAAQRLWIGTQENGLLCYAAGAIHREGGVPTETINSVASDGKGNLWLGTPSGLCRLNGGQLTRFTTKEGLPNDFVSSVNVARSGTIWITTHGGMCQFRNDKIIPFPFQTDNPGRNPESLGVYEDRSGNLWAFGDTYLVNLTGGKHLNHFGSGELTASARIWSLCEGRQGELWIGASGKGLYCFADNQFVPITLRNGELTSDVRALCEDREGNLWLGTRGNGLIRLQPQNVQALGAGAGLPNRPVVCLGLNPQGRAWIGFDRDGLYAGSAERFDRLAGEAAADLQNLVSSVAVAADSTVWAGTPGAGLYCVDNQRSIHYGTANGLSDNTILSVAVDKTGAVWAGTLAGGLNRIAAGRVTNYGVEAGLRDEPITAILPARNGDLWIGFDDGGIARWSAGKFSTLIDPPALDGKAIRALYEDNAGRVWAGTAGGRLACFVGRRFLKWDLSLAPADNAIAGILSDDEGNLWLSTTRIIYHLAKSDIETALAERTPLRPQLVFESDAAPSATAITYGWPRAARSAAGKLWFGLAGGVVTLEPRRLVFDTTPLPVLIESITVNGRALPLSEIKAPARTTNQIPQPARLPSDLRSLEFQFTALNFSTPEKIRFRHRLDGFDPDWVDGGTDRRVSYGHLLYGRYTFQVQAGDAGSWFTNGAAFSFVVPTPLWRTNWALTLYSLAAALLVAVLARLAFNRRLRRRLEVLAAQQAMERERIRIAKDMHDEIGSKLTKISFMSERAKGELHGQAEPVARKLDAIAHTSRDLLQSLDEIVWAVNPHNDTLEHLAAYLGHYATEYLQNTAVECELHIPQGLPHHPLSAETRHNLFLAFEEALNNALKHGKASRVRVGMEWRAAQFEIRVEDNGCGFAADELFSRVDSTRPPTGRRVGHGLRNLQQRLADVGGQCHVRSRPGHGTTVILTVPLRTAKAPA
jgi:ligand-binding sensor domain-containing protein/signal transduction histidine kinase